MPYLASIPLALLATLSTIPRNRRSTGAPSGGFPTRPYYISPTDFPDPMKAPGHMRPGTQDGPQPSMSKRRPGDAAGLCRSADERPVKLLSARTRTTSTRATIHVTLPGFGECRFRPAKPGAMEAKTGKFTQNGITYEELPAVRCASSQPRAQRVTVRQSCCRAS